MIIDYYQILQIPPSSDLAAIKSAYRRLAHQYHPDKNDGSKSALAYFELIKEAYETLSNADKKGKYLQERWLAKANGQAFDPPTRTPEHLLAQVLTASDRISKMDVYRMDKEGIRLELGFLLSDEKIAILNDFNEISINNAVVNELLYCTAVLPTNQQIELLKTFRQINSSFTEIIQNKEEDLTAKAFWENWKPAFVIMIVILLCILIWSTSFKY